MNNHFLTTKNFIKGKVFDFLEKFILDNNNDVNDDTGPEFKLIKWVRKQDEENFTSVGYFEYKNKIVVIKSVKFNLKNSIYEQLINEANMLNILSSLSKNINANKKYLKFPKVHKLIYKPHKLSLVTEFFEAEALKSKSNSFKIIVLNTVLSEFRKMSLVIDKDMRKNLPKRSYFQILITFPIYLLKVIFLDYRNILRYIKYSFIFYRKYIVFSNFKMKYFLAHKDLHSDNILIKDNSVLIIDPEICVLADSVTDIAQISRYYSEEFTEIEMNNFLNEALKTNNQKNNFIALTIYYSIQMMAIRNRKNQNYIEAKNYLLNYFDKIKLNKVINEKNNF